jgi:predicted ATP-binding protein involved in virulence
MRLARVLIANFKGLREVQFEPTRFSCLVGENNAGKSTVLQEEHRQKIEPLVAEGRIAGRFRQPAAAGGDRAGDRR